MNQLIGNVASNINQIAVRVNSTNKIYEEDFEEIEKGQEEIWRQLKSLRLQLQKVKP